MAGKDKQRTKRLEWVCIQRSCTVRDFMAGRRGRCRKTVREKKSKPRANGVARAAVSTINNTYVKNLIPPWG